MMTDNDVSGGGVGPGGGPTLHNNEWPLQPQFRQNLVQKIEDTLRRQGLLHPNINPAEVEKNIFHKSNSREEYTKNIQHFLQMCMQKQQQMVTHGQQQQMNIQTQQQPQQMNILLQQQQFKHLNNNQMVQIGTGAAGGLQQGQQQMVGNIQQQMQHGPQQQMMNQNMVQMQNPQMAGPQNQQMAMMTQNNQMNNPDAMGKQQTGQGPIQIISRSVGPKMVNVNHFTVNQGGPPNQSQMIGGQTSNVTVNVANQQQMVNAAQQQMNKNKMMVANHQMVVNNQQQPTAGQQPNNAFQPAGPHGQMTLNQIQMNQQQQGSQGTSGPGVQTVALQSHLAQQQQQHLPQQPGQTRMLQPNQQPMMSRMIASNQQQIRQLTHPLQLRLPRQSLQQHQQVGNLQQPTQQQQNQMVGIGPGGLQQGPQGTNMPIFVLHSSQTRQLNASQIQQQQQIQHQIQQQQQIQMQQSNQSVGPNFDVQVANQQQTQRMTSTAQQFINKQQNQVQQIQQMHSGPVQPNVPVQQQQQFAPNQFGGGQQPAQLISGPGSLVQQQQTLQTIGPKPGQPLNSTGPGGILPGVNQSMMADGDNVHNQMSGMGPKGPMNVGQQQGQPTGGPHGPPSKMIPSSNANMMTNQQQQNILLTSPGSHHMGICSNSGSPANTAAGTNLPLPSPINRATGNNPPHMTDATPSPQNQQLNTPSSVQSQQRATEEQIYQEKLQSMQKYIEPLMDEIKKNDKNDPSLNKMKNLYHILTGSQRTTLAVLEKCEKYLETRSKCNSTQNNNKMNQATMVNDADSSTINNNSSTISDLPSLSAQSKTASVMSLSSLNNAIGSGSLAMSQTSRVQDTCQPLLDAVMRNFRKPTYFHVAHKTFGPALSVLNPEPYQLTNRVNISGNFICYSNMATRPIHYNAMIHRRNALKRKSFHLIANHSGCNLRKPLADILQGEIARLDIRFKVQSLANSKRVGSSKCQHLLCKLDDAKLPCVPPIVIYVAEDYPRISPRYELKSYQHKTCIFFSMIYTNFENNMSKMPGKYSLTLLLNVWERSIQQAMCSISSWPTNTSFNQTDSSAISKMFKGDNKTTAWPNGTGDVQMNNNSNDENSLPNNISNTNGPNGCNNTKT